MNIIRSIGLVFILVAPISINVFAQQEKTPNISLDTLLEEVRLGRQRDARENSERLQEFKKEKANQQAIFNELKAEEKRQENLSEQNEKKFEENELSINGLQERLTERLGSLKELFGVLQQVSSDAQAQFYGSLIQLQYPERDEYLANFSKKMGQTTE